MGIVKSLLSFSSTHTFVVRFLIPSFIALLMFSSLSREYPFSPHNYKKHSYSLTLYLLAGASVLIFFSLDEIVGFSLIILLMLKLKLNLSDWVHFFVCLFVSLTDSYSGLKELKVFSLGQTSSQSPR